MYHIAVGLSIAFGPSPVKRGPGSGGGSTHALDTCSRSVLLTYALDEGLGERLGHQAHRKLQASARSGEDSFAPAPPGGRKTPGHTNAPARPPSLGGRENSGRPSKRRALLLGGQSFRPRNNPGEGGRGGVALPRVNSKRIWAAPAAAVSIANGSSCGSGGAKP